MVTEWPSWWCCLHYQWRYMFNWMGDWTPTPFPQVFKSVYDAQFATLIAPTDSWLYDWFNAQFEVSFPTVSFPIIGDIVTAEWELASWGQYHIFKATDEWACPKLCRYSTGNFALP
jgi:hypothetical protein